MNKWHHFMLLMHKGSLNYCIWSYAHEPLDKLVHFMDQILLIIPLEKSERKNYDRADKNNLTDAAIWATG